MPVVRGRFMPEISFAGRAKQLLDVLLWTNEFEKRDIDSLDELECLRIYLRSLEHFACYIRLLVPASHVQTAELLAKLGIEHVPVGEQEAEDDVSSRFKNADAELLRAVGTALAVDADCLVVSRRDWLPFVEEADDLGFILTDCSFLLLYSEVFCRGFHVPWAFASKVWHQPWTAFYNLSEIWTFKPGTQLLQLAYEKKAPTDAQETGRVLVYTRLPNLCFTRDRLFFFQIQQSASKRAGRRRQPFTFEVSYFLNFFYLLIYGAFDHAALFVNQLLALGLPEREVGATYKSFLKALRAKSPPLHAIFTDARNTEFLDRIGELRHRAAHRGAIMPRMIVDKPDKEPTTEELDADIREAGNDVLVDLFAPGTARDNLREMLRANARMARYERGRVLEGVELTEINGKRALINPLVDTPWNFSRTIGFLNAVFGECSRILG